MNIPSSSELFNIIERDCPVFNTSLSRQQTVWHYTSAEGFKSIMEEGMVHFTHNAFLNDSTERTHIFDIAEKVLASYAEDEEKREFIESLECIFRRKRDDPDSVDFSDEDETQVFIFSCSMDKDSLPLWNHYSKNPAKAGFSIGLDIKEVMNLMFENEIIGSVGSSLYPVIYDNNEKFRLVKDICETGYCLWRGGDKDKIIKETYSAVRVAGTFLKHKAFASEHEARYILYIQNKQLEDMRNLLKFKNAYGIFIPYIPVPFVNNETLKGVVISPTLKAKQAKSYADLFLRMNNYKVAAETSQVPLRF